MADNSMAAAVLERCKIQPLPDAVPEFKLPLLHFDLPWLPFHAVKRLLFFESSVSKSLFLESVVPKLKESLSLTLTHFLPFAGNIVYPSDSSMPFSRFRTGDSVSFTVAESDKDFQHLVGNHARIADDFYSCVPALPPLIHSADEVVAPVLAVQVTFFPGNGICLGFSNHHGVGDASTIVRFIQVWASVNRFGADSKMLDEKSLPSYDRSTVQDPTGLDSIYWNMIKDSCPVQLSLPAFPLNKVRATFVLTKEDAQNLKNFVVWKNQEMRHPTVFAVTCALVWVCLVKTAEVTEEVDDDEPEYFAIAADGRGRLNPPLPATYFGNCLTLVKAQSTHGLLKAGEDGFLAAVHCIGEAIQNSVYNKKGILDGAENWPLEFKQMVGKHLFGVAGSPRFDLYDADYGWGRPVKYEAPSIDSDTSMSLCKSRDSEGGVEIGLSRTKKELDTFAGIFSEMLSKLRSPDLS